MDASLYRTYQVVGCVSLVGVSVLWFLVPRIVARCLAPLSRVSEQIEQIEVGSLDRDFDPADVPQEIVPITTRLRELFEKLHVAFERERSYAADVAHELRTPLAGLHSTLEVSLRKPRVASEYRDAIEQAIQITKETEGVVESLLLISRLDSQSLQRSPAPVAVAGLIEEEVDRVATESRPKDLTIRVSVPNEMVVHTDREYLAVIFRNLLANSVQYADLGGQVTVSSPDQASLQIENTGCTLSKADVEGI